MLLAALLALALAAADAPFGGKLPFPAPRLAQVTERTKCDFGTVLSVEPERATVRALVPAGVVTYHVGPEVQVFDQDGKLLGSMSVLSVGQRVRVYYLVDDAARVSEIDLE